VTIGIAKVPARGLALGRRLGRLLEATGAETVRWVHVLLVFTAFCATAAIAALRRDSWRHPVRLTLYTAIDRVAVQCAITTLGTGVLLGFVLVTEVVFWLQTAGQVQLVGIVVVRVLVREITPIVVGLIIFGRAGTQLLVELGDARPKGWLRQLERWGIDPITLLVMPRMVGFAIGAFCLAVMLLISTLVTGYLVASLLGLISVSIWQFSQNVVFATTAGDFILPPVKCLTIGAGVALVCCATAVARGSEAEELQRVVQRGFVRSALTILIVNGVFDLAA
jgi:phospholipid/cholesterol/gamma-HCH transport system permease protein